MVKWKNSITAKLLKITFSIYLVVTITVTGLHMVAEYHNEKSVIFNDLILFSETSEQGIANALWNLDDNQLNSILDGILKLPTVVGVTVLNQKTEVIISKGETLLATPNNSNLIEFDTILVYPLRDGLNIGALKLYSSQSIIFDKVKYNFLFILINALIKTIALWVIVLIVGKRIITRPLSELSEKTESLDLDNIINYSMHLEGNSENEIGILVESFNRMLHKLKEDSEKIEDRTRMAEELKSAAAIQEALFPKDVPITEVLDFTTYYKAASEASGDWYGFMDYFKGNIYVYIGDVTGHGTPSAIVATTAFTTMNMVKEMYEIDYTITENKPSPKDLLHFLNIAVHEAGQEKYLMTFLMLKINTNTLECTICNAGHTFPFWIKNDGSIKRMLNTNSQLGLSNFTKFSENKYTLEKGDKIILYTDGLTENMNEDQKEWGENNLKRLLKKVHTKDIRKMTTEIVSCSTKHYGNEPLDDDISIVGIEVC